MNRTTTKYAMAQVVSFGPPIKEERDKIQAIHVGFMVESVANGYVFFSEYYSFPLSLSFNRCSIFTHSYTTNVTKL
jgi:hypothetical protein